MRNAVDRVALFEEKIEEYYLSCMPSIRAMEDKSFLQEWPLYKFAIRKLYPSLTRRTSEEVHGLLADKLVDIKLHFTYLLTVNEHFLRGATLIVGNNELEKLNPNTISALRGIHYRVYLLSVLFEQLFDLLHVTLKSKSANFKRGKWTKIIDLVQGATGEAIVSRSDADLIELFKAQVRTAELHKFSMVRALTGKDRWTHLQEEEWAASRILGNVYSYYTA